MNGRPVLKLLLGDIFMLIYSALEGDVLQPQLLRSYDSPRMVQSCFVSSFGIDAEGIRTAAETYGGLSCGGKGYFKGEALQLRLRSLYFDATSIADGLYLAMKSCLDPPET